MGVLYARVGGQWVPVIPSAPDEVWVGPNGPPDVATELWYDTDEPPAGQLKVKVGGSWVPAAAAGGGGGGAGADEVWIGPNAPLDSAIELWVDSDAAMPLTEDMRWNTAWGIVATAPGLGAVTVDSTPTTICTPLNITLLAGRRYRYVAYIRAIDAASPHSSNMDLYEYATTLTPVYGGSAHSYSSNTFSGHYAEWIIDGAGQHYVALHIKADSSISCIWYTDPNSQFYVEDVGPVSGFVPAPNPTPAWIPVTFQNGWTNYGSGWQTAQYRKVGDEVQLRGLIAGGTTTDVCTLPVGFRPPAPVQFWTYTAPAGPMTVHPSGLVQVDTGGARWLNLSFSVTP